jgi:hypothetical protein
MGEGKSGLLDALSGHFYSHIMALASRLLTKKLVRNKNGVLHPDSIV